MRENTPVVGGGVEKDFNNPQYQSNHKQKLNDLLYAFSFKTEGDNTNILSDTQVQASANENKEEENQACDLKGIDKATHYSVYPFTISI